MDEGTEGEAVPPGGGEVPDVDPRVARGDLPAPGLQPGHASHQHLEIRLELLRSGHSFLPSLSLLRSRFWWWCSHCGWPLTTGRVPARRLTLSLCDAVSPSQSQPGKSLFALSLWTDLSLPRTLTRTFDFFKSFHSYSWWMDAGRLASVPQPETLWFYRLFFLLPPRPSFLSLVLVVEFSRFMKVYSYMAWKINRNNPSSMDHSRIRNDLY